MKADTCSALRRCAGINISCHFQPKRRDCSPVLTMKITALLLLFIAGALGQSCVGRCGVNDGVSGCQCNSVCSNYGDCCSDYNEVCLSCKGRCGEAYVYSKPCQCNNECGSHGNCCSDYDVECGGGSGGGVTDADLKALTEELYSLDVNSVGSQLVLNHQGQGSSGELAPEPLFASVPESALQGPTISLLRQLQDNYVPSVSTSEDEDAAETAEQEAFLDAIMATQVMQRAETFLTEKSLLSGSLRDKLKEIWFMMYSRAGSTLGSSGFEHVFVGELKSGDVSGFHNWVYFYHEELEGDLNYMGWSKTVDLGDKGEIVMDHFDWLNTPKPKGSMMVGTSPELDMAMFTVCFLARPDSKCPVQMNNHEFRVQTWTLNYNGHVLVGSAYPDI
ncbi:poly(U)-specific endoribonuclease-like [Penaeus japonicus]|uniref:poly(U)-specific endoribonuclease-like n=1 Tax=Penaeus japonicus TaxID=27405 RepID=UPI001C71581E|nr:poly(U)-specific endoribonuclease-like [Penaeus japonicus]